MCPFCISAVVSVAAGTVTTAGVVSLFAFARRIPERMQATALAEHRPTPERNERSERSP